MKVKNIGLILSCLLMLPVLALFAQDTKKPSDTLTFFGNPGERMQSINRILREAGEKVMEQKRQLDSVVEKIVAGERRLKNESLQAEEREKICQENINFFKEIETIRERIARIQNESSQQIFRLEQTFHMNMTADIARKRARLAQNPAEYWLEIRKLLFSNSEQNTLLTENEARNLDK